MNRNNCRATWALCGMLAIPPNLTNPELAEGVDGEAVVFEAVERDAASGGGLFDGVVPSIYCRA